MNKAIERDLLSLLPSITLPLPRELLEVAVSLLSQSRSKAGSLRQDEEIARGYVCAHIACDRWVFFAIGVSGDSTKEDINRLKTKLNLPAIVIRPPVGPKTYKKLYAYFDSALAAGTPRKQQKHAAIGRDEPTTPSKQQPVSTNGTPKRTPVRTVQAKSPSGRSSTKRKHEGLEGDSNVPSWTMPAIRSVCKIFKIPHASPHIFVGVSSIIQTIHDQQDAATNTPAKKRARRSAGNESISATVFAFEDAHLPALIVVVAFFTRSHLLGAPKPSEYAAQRTAAINAILKHVPEEVVKEDEKIIAMVEDLLREVENGWLDMDWYHNLPDPADGLEREVEETNESALGIEDEGDRSVRNLQVPKRGFGSMMTDATDYLSEEKRADYRRWKSNILRRIGQIERSGERKTIMT